MTSPEASDRESFHAIVRGRVQGVGFRFFVERRARQFAVGGLVRNGEDGESVDVVAEGDADSIEKLRVALHQGRRSPASTPVELTPSELQGFSGFVVRF